MNKYKLKFASKLSHSPCLQLAVAAWSHLLETDRADPRYTGVISGDHKVIWIECEGRPVSVMIYSINETEASAWIYVSYTIHEHRRKGLYTRLYNDLVSRLRKDKITRVQSGISITNIIMGETAKKTGRSPEYIVWSQNI